MLGGGLERLSVRGAHRQGLDLRGMSSPHDALPKPSSHTHVPSTQLPWAEQPARHATAAVVPVELPPSGEASWQ